MAGDATDVIFRMLRVNCIHVLRTAGVAGQAARIDFFGRVFAKDENLRFVAAARDVSRTGTVTILAAVLRDPAFLVCLLPVRAFLPAIVEVFMASLAGLRSHILRSLGGTCGCSRG